MSRTRVTPNSINASLYKILLEHSEALDRLDGNPEAAFEYTVNTVYATATGSDTTGDGTQANPWRTFVRACKAVPLVSAPGVFWDIDITDLGDETLPADFTLPAWKNSHAFTADLGDPYFYIRSGVRIRADFKLAATLTETAATITATTSVVSDPVDNIVTIEDTTKSWTPGALVGLQCVGAVGAFERSVIVANDATHIVISTDAVPTLPVRIMEASARLLTTATIPFGFGGGLNVVNQDSLMVGGVRVESLTPGEVSVFEYGSTVWWLSCHVTKGLYCNPIRQIGIENSNIVSPEFQGETYLFGNRVHGMSFPPGRPANVQFNSIAGNVFDECPTLEVFDTATSQAVAGGLLLCDSTRFTGSTGDAAIKWHGGNATIKNTKIVDSEGDALWFDGPGLHYLENVAGTGNGGVGVRVTNGAQVQIDGATVTVTGTNNQKVGNLAAGAYPAAPFNKVDWTYDPTGGAPTQVTGTGARLFSE